MLGRLSVAISFGLAFCNIGKVLIPVLELDDTAVSLAGAALVLVMLAIRVWAWRMRRTADPA